MPRCRCHLESETSHQTAGRPAHQGSAPGHGSLIMGSVSSWGVSVSSWGHFRLMFVRSYLQFESHVETAGAEKRRKVHFWETLFFGPNHRRYSRLDLLLHSVSLSQHYILPPSILCCNSNKGGVGGTKPHKRARGKGFPKCCTQR